MEDIFASDDNSTPLTTEEKFGLKAKWIALRSELNDMEASNIASALKWLVTNPPKDFLNTTFLLKLHKKMFCDVWNWAGEFRTTEKNIGVAPYQIAIKLQSLFEDVKFWIENKTYPDVEIAIRFHHRLVQIHPFPNGNGRISRIMADVLAQTLGEEKLYWGNSSLVNISEERSFYISALRKADAGDYTDLISFASKNKTT